MHPFFEPKRLAVIGVSDARLSLGRIVFQNAFHLGFQGEVFGVGSFSDPQFDSHMVRSVEDLPDDVDLAVVLTPAASIPQILSQCGEKGIRRVVIESAGFSEFQDAGRALEREVLAIARAHGIRVMGPNCVGTINAGRGLFLPFAAIPKLPSPGGISLISQSGGVGTHFFLRLAEEGLGLAKFSSVGNKLDLDEVDVLEYMIEDPETTVIGLYLESISRGRELFDLIRRSGKPIVILKSNRSATCAAAAQSHTAALSSDDDVVEAAIRQAGGIRVSSASQMIDTLKALCLPRLKGNRLAVLSRSGGHAVVTVDACVAHGFSLAAFPEAFLDRLAQWYSARVITRQNPLDLGEVFDYRLFGKIAAEALALDQVDGLIFNHIYVAGVESPASRAFLKDIADLQRRVQKPILVTFATELREVMDCAREISYPLFHEPEAAVAALRRASRWTGPRQDSQSPQPSIHTIDDLPLPCDGNQPTLPEALDLLQRWKVPVVPYRFARTESEALHAADALGFPLAVKVVSERASHKTDVGGVALGVADSKHLTRVLRDMTQNMERRFGPDQMQGFCLQPMVRDGVEVIVGGRRDAQFGPVVMLGLGGVLVELLRDFSLRLAPVSAAQAKSMIADLRGQAVLHGFRGAPAADLEALAELVSRVSHLLAAHPEIAEIDLNPVRISSSGAQVLDARLVVNPSV